MSSSEPVISVRGMSKTYRLYGSPYDRIKEALPWNDQPRHKPVHALHDINFDVHAGQCVGLVGGNGAGKSTLLKILTGTSFPSTGEYTMHGRVASLLELGAGFHMDFSGRDNIYMNAAMMGIPRRETDRRYQEILDFSELHDFIDSPLRTYSSGMVCRLGFSVAVATDPDVLIIDEILAVGDMHFQRKCVDRIFDYKNRNKTILFCSHSMYDVRQICTDALWLKDGKLEMMGDAVAVTNEYSTYENQLASQEERATDMGDIKAAEDLPRIISAQLIDVESGEARNTISPGMTLGVRMHVKNGAIPEPINMGVAVTSADRSIICCFGTEDDGVPVNMDEGIITLVLPDMKMLSGEYVVMTGVLDRHGVHRFHQLPTDKNLVVQNRTRDLGIFLHDHKWVQEPNIASGSTDQSSGSERTA